ncbi:Leukocyte surface antigen cd53 [Cichlidogyrus casuarinus]|uniref:Leukocyte surface antigen cd53 n=1 Tax=Cichlidogyrus casuarinus TaxID=1844966 RepID=A0ABD2Q0Z3_9PLAT
MCSTCENLFLVLFAVICGVLLLSGFVITSIGGILTWNSLLLVDPVPPSFLSESVGMISLTQRLIAAFNQALALSAFAGGLFLVALATIGLIGALKKNRFLLMAFFCFVLTIILAVVTFVILYAVDDTWFKNIVIRMFFDQLGAKYEIRFSNSRYANKFTRFWDLFQTLLECCGVYDWNDYHYAKDSSLIKDQKVPLSCCRMPISKEDPCPRNPTTNNSFIDKPCGVPIFFAVENAQTTGLLIAALGIAIALFIETACMGALWSVCHRIQSIGFVHEHHFLKQRARIHRELFKRRKVKYASLEDSTANADGVVSIVNTAAIVMSLEFVPVAGKAERLTVVGDIGQLQQMRRIEGFVAVRSNVEMVVEDEAFLDQM